ncbi:MAG: hypothetical protein ACTSVY_00055 [Candidatus Helarchaeota archaeon]
MQDSAAEIRTMFDKIIEKLTSLTKSIDLLNKNIKFLSESTTNNVKNLGINVNKFVNAIDNIFHVSEFEKMTDELKQLNSVVQYELDQVGVTTLLSELAQKVVKISDMLEKQDGETDG